MIKLRKWMFFWFPRIWDVLVLCEELKEDPLVAKRRGDV